MKITKFYWKNELGFCRCYLSYGYIKSFIHLKELFEIAKRDYPEVGEDKFEVIKITNSDRIKHYMCITFLINKEPLEDYEYISAS